MVFSQILQIKARITHQPARITKADKDFSKRIDFKNIKFPVKARNIL